MEAASRVQVHEITVPRTSRYATLGEGVSAIDEVWLVCHGYAQLASRFIQRFEVIDNGQRLIVAPEALSRFYLSGMAGHHSDSDKVGASWMTREGRDFEIADYITYLDLVVASAFERGGSLGARFIALGFSQGAATVCRWAARTRRPPDQLVIWGAGVPADLFEGDGRAGLGRMPITVVIGDSDPVGSQGRTAAHLAQLDAAGIRCSIVPYDGGHEMDAAVLARLAKALSGNERVGVAPVR